MKDVPTIGQLRSVVVFERNQPTKLGAGQMDNFAPYLTTRGKVVIGSGRLMDDAKNPVFFSKYTLFVRFRQQMELNKKIRIVVDNKIFRIESYQIIDQRKFFYKIDMNADE